MTTRFRIRAALLVGVFALAASACGDDSDEPAAGDSTTTEDPGTDEPGDDGDDGDEGEDGEPTAGGTLTMAVYSEPSGLDPVVAQGGGTGGNHEMGAIYDTLMRYDSDSGTYEPQLAESLTPNDDFTEWTLTLRPDVQFSDGTDFDAEAVAFSVERHMEHGSTLSGLVSAIEDSEVVDDLTVVFTLNGPWPNFPYLFSNTVGMVPSPTAIEDMCEPDQPARECDFNSNPVGAGPFVVDDYQPGEALTMERNPDYWGGEVYLDGLRFVPPQAAGILYEQVVDDAIQVTFLREERTIQQVHDEDRVQTHQELMGFGRVILINNGQVTCRNGQPEAICADQPDGIVDLEKPTGDVRVRQAISYAIDPEQLDQRMTEGNGIPTREFFAPESPYAVGPSGEYDPDRARELLEDAKEDLDWDGSLTVGCLQEQSHAQPFVQTVQALLNNVGFDITTELTPATEYITNIQATRNYDLGCWGFNIPEEAPEAGLSRHVLSVAGGNSGGNAMNLDNPEIDEQIFAIREAATVEEKQAGFEGLLEIWREEQPSIVFGVIPEVIASHPRVNGLKYNVATSVLFDEAWLSD